MEILVACKIVPDDQDVQIGADGSLDFSRAHQVVSEYDLNAIEAAVRLAEANDGATVKAISVGPASADESKVKKSILSRGVDELFLVANDSCKEYDAAATAAELAELTKAAGGFDVILTGSGSADFYARQVGVHLADRLGIPYISNVVELSVEGSGLLCTRSLESVREIVQAPCPAVVSILPEAAEPRIAGMKDILAAGKKPANVVEPACVVAPTVKTEHIAAPEQADRRQQICESVDEFVAAFKLVL